MNCSACRVDTLISAMEHSFFKPENFRIGLTIQHLNGTFQNQNIAISRLGSTNWLAISRLGLTDLLAI